jgi:hypothetical protein
MLVELFNLEDHAGHGLQLGVKPLSFLMSELRDINHNILCFFTLATTRFITSTQHQQLRAKFPNILAIIGRQLLNRAICETRERLNRSRNHCLLGGLDDIRISGDAPLSLKWTPWSETSIPFRTVNVDGITGDISYVRVKCDLSNIENAR